MVERRFPICGIPIPTCIGRKVLLDRMTSALTKAVPDHLQVTGPQFSGKTVLLAELTHRLRSAGSCYQAVLVWDLAHQAIGDDGQFIHMFGQQLALALKADEPTYAAQLESRNPIETDEIAEVLDALTAEGVTVLAILDRFDRAVADNTLSRNLWDQLRDLASRPSLRLVVASGKRLSELICNPDAETSPFWNIFDPAPIEVGPFNDTDIDDVLRTVPEVHLSTGARAELTNATNYSPIMALEVLNTLLQRQPSGDVSPEAMRSACDEAYPALRDRIELLWNSSGISAKDLFRRVRSEGSVSYSDARPADIAPPLAAGFIRRVGNKLQHPNGLLCAYLDERPQEDGALARLFNSQTAYEKNLKSVLERRIVQIDDIDAQLKRYLQRGAEDLPDDPALFLSSIRGIVDCAFELIWKAEIPDRRIPSGWMSTWKYNRERGGVEDWETRFPQGVHRVRLLNLMTGTDRSDSVAKYVSRTTYATMNAVHGFGDFGQHREGAPVFAGTGYAALYLCIELAAALAHELPH